MATWKREYEYRGPGENSGLSDRERESIKSVSDTVREVHRHAGLPTASALALEPSLPSSSTIYDLFYGTRLPSWPLTWQVASGLARRAHYDERRIRELYVRLREAYVGRSPTEEN